MKRVFSMVLVLCMLLSLMPVSAFADEENEVPEITQEETAVETAVEEAPVLCAAPTITKQPEDYSGPVGDKAEFTVAAQGDGLSYQWQYQAAANTTSWGNSSSKTVGYNTPTLKVDITEARNGYKYRCVVTDANGTAAYSETAVLYVTAKTEFAIISQPADFTGAVGETAIFTVAATGEGLSYQWQYDANSGKGWVNSSSATVGHNTDSLQVVITEKRNNYKYRCIVSDANGNTLASDAAVLHTVADNKLEIISQPMDYSGVVGEMAIFTVAAQGEGLTYQWQYNANSGKGWVNSSSATFGYNTDTLQVSITEKRDNYSYRCVITDAMGNSVTSDEVVLHVKEETVDLRIVSEPENYEGREGDTAVFSVVAEGEGLTYQWQFKSATSKTWRNSTATSHGYNTASMQIAITEARNGYSYRCVVTDAEGNTVTSDAAVLTVINTVALEIVAQPVDYTGMVDETAVFTVEAVGEGLTYQWQFRAATSKTWKNSTATSPGYNTASMQVAITEARNGYSYRCIVTDAEGYTLTSDEVVLHAVPARKELSIVGQPVNYKGVVGEMASFSVDAEGEGLTYQWQYQTAPGKAWKNSTILTDGYNSEVLNVKITNTRNGYSYRCVVTDDEGNKLTSDIAVLRIKMPLAIIEQPSDVNTGFDTDAVFAVSATGEGLIYVWYQVKPDGSAVRVGGASSPVLTVHTSDSNRGCGYYCVVIDEDDNTVQSNVAYLYFGSGIVITRQPESCAVNPRFEVMYTFETEASGDGIRYQWQYLDGGEWHNVDQAYEWNSSYSVALSSVDGDYTVRCRIIDSYGEEAYTDTAVLHIMPALEIIEGPADITVFEGETAELSILAVGENLSYRWYRNNELIPDANESVYSFVADDSMNGDTFYCEVSDNDFNYDWSTSETAVVTVKHQLEINGLLCNYELVEQGGDAARLEGYTTYITVDASGDGLSYQWQYSADGGRTWRNTTISGYKTEEIRFEMSSARDGQMLRCAVTDAYGVTEYSYGIVLRCIRSVTIRNHPISTDVHQGEIAEFSVYAVGSGNITYQWMFKDEDDYTEIPGANDRILRIDTTDYVCGSYYVYCIVTQETGNNIYEAESYSAQLGVLSIPELEVRETEVYAVEGESWTLSVGSYGVMRQVFWDYSIDGGNTWQPLNRSIYNSDYITIDAIYARDNYMYRCTAVDKLGMQAVSEPITVKLVYSELDVGENTVIDGTYTFIAPKDGVYAISVYDAYMNIYDIDGNYIRSGNDYVTTGRLTAGEEVQISVNVYDRTAAELNIEIIEEVSEAEIEILSIDCTRPDQTFVAAKFAIPGKYSGFANVILRINENADNTGRGWATSNYFNIENYAGGISFSAQLAANTTYYASAEIHIENTQETIYSETVSFTTGDFEEDRIITAEGTYDAEAGDVIRFVPESAGIYSISCNDGYVNVYSNYSWNQYEKIGIKIAEGESAVMKFYSYSSMVTNFSITYVGESIEPGIVTAVPEVDDYIVDCGAIVSYDADNANLTFIFGGDADSTRGEYYNLPSGAYYERPMIWNREMAPGSYTYRAVLEVYEPTGPVYYYGQEENFIVSSDGYTSVEADVMYNAASGIGKYSCTVPETGLYKAECDNGYIRIANGGMYSSYNDCIVYAEAGETVYFLIDHYSDNDQFRLTNLENNMVDLSVGTQTICEGTYYRFTAEEAGDYTFNNNGYFYLARGTKNFSHWINYFGSNVFTLEAGETVYIKIYGYGDFTISLNAAPELGEGEIISVGYTIENGVVNIKAEVSVYSGEGRLTIITTDQNGNEAAASGFGRVTGENEQRTCLAALVPGVYTCEVTLTFNPGTPYRQDITRYMEIVVTDDDIPSYSYGEKVYGENGAFFYSVTVPENGVYKAELSTGNGWISVGPDEYNRYGRRLYKSAQDKLYVRGSFYEPGHYSIAYNVMDEATALVIGSNSVADEAYYYFTAEASADYLFETNDAPAEYVNLNGSMNAMETLCYSNYPGMIHMDAGETVVIIPFGTGSITISEAEPIEYAVTDSSCYIDNGIVYFDACFSAPGNSSGNEFGIEYSSYGAMWITGITPIATETNPVENHYAGKSFALTPGTYNFRGYINDGSKYTYGDWVQINVSKENFPDINVEQVYNVNGESMVTVARFTAPETGYYTVETDYSRGELGLAGIPFDEQPMRVTAGTDVYVAVYGCDGIFIVRYLGDNVLTVGDNTVNIDEYYNFVAEEESVYHFTATGGALSVCTSYGEGGSSEYYERLRAGEYIKLRVQSGSSETATVTITRRDDLLTELPLPVNTFRINKPDLNGTEVRFFTGTLNVPSLEKDTFPFIAFYSDSELTNKVGQLGGGMLFEPANNKFMSVAGSTFAPGTYYAVGVVATMTDGVLTESLDSHVVSFTVEDSLFTPVGLDTEVTPTSGATRYYSFTAGEAGYYYCNIVNGGGGFFKSASYSRDVIVYLNAGETAYMEMSGYSDCSFTVTDAVPLLTQVGIGKYDTDSGISNALYFVAEEDGYYTVTNDTIYASGIPMTNAADPQLSRNMFYAAGYMVDTIYLQAGESMIIMASRDCTITISKGNGLSDDYLAFTDVTAEVINGAVKLSSTVTNLHGRTEVYYIIRPEGMEHPEYRSDSFMSHSQVYEREATIWMGVAPGSYTAEAVMEYGDGMNEEYHSERISFTVSESDFTPISVGETISFDGSNARSYVCTADKISVFGSSWINGMAARVFNARNDRDFFTLNEGEKCYVTISGAEGTFTLVNQAENTETVGLGENQLGESLYYVFTAPEDSYYSFASVGEAAQYHVFEADGSVSSYFSRCTVYLNAGDKVLVSAGEDGIPVACTLTITQRDEPASAGITLNQPEVNGASVIFRGGYTTAADSTTSYYGFDVFSDSHLSKQVDRIRLFGDRAGIESDFYFARGFLPGTYYIRPAMDWDDEEGRYYEFIGTDVYSFTVEESAFSPISTGNPVSVDFRQRFYVYTAEYDGYFTLASTNCDCEVMLAESGPRSRFAYARAGEKVYFELYAISSDALIAVTDVDLVPKPEGTYTVTRSEQCFFVAAEDGVYKVSYPMSGPSPSIITNAADPDNNMRYDEQTGLLEHYFNLHADESLIISSSYSDVQVTIEKTDVECSEYSLEVLSTTVEETSVTFSVRAGIPWNSNGILMRVYLIDADGNEIGYAGRAVFDAQGTYAERSFKFYTLTPDADYTVKVEIYDFEDVICEEYIEIRAKSFGGSEILLNNAERIAANETKAFEFNAETTGLYYCSFLTADGDSAGLLASNVYGYTYTGNIVVYVEQGTPAYFTVECEDAAGTVILSPAAETLGYLTLNNPVQLGAEEYFLFTPDESTLYGLVFEAENEIGVEIIISTDEEPYIKNFYSEFTPSSAEVAVNLEAGKLYCIGIRYYGEGTAEMKIVRSSNPTVLSGSYGTVEYTLSADGHLEIGGSGFAGASNGFRVPWSNRYVTEIVISEGITAVGTDLLMGSSVTEVRLPSTVKSVESRAFEANSFLSKVYIPAGIEYIASDAFSTNPVTDIYFAGTEAQWNAVDMGSNAWPEDVTVHFNVDYYG